ncbi:MAG: hypothetical protein AMS14_04570 [Planctomycetes bacterium DG_20]|nr:MAG: hypothetical protein AMS14_04570 [Planctomycetes bacterium DG_20]
MRRKARLAGAFCAVLLALAAALRGADSDEATETFNSLYGADLARVRETGDARDDVELAARLLAAAKKAADQPALLAVLCEKACDLALGHPTGYATALEAMDLLARTVPAKAAECAARTLDIRQKQFDAATGDEKKAAGELLLGALLPVIEAKEQAGDLAEAAALYRKAKTIAAASGSPRADEIDARAEALALRMKIAARLADVKALLERDPKNVSAREGLVRLYLVDLDDPAEAAKYLKGVEDEALLKYVPAAAKGVEAPPELACLELGEWYRDLAATAPPHAKEAMYARAKAYLDRFLEIHPTKDLSRTRAALALEKIQETVAKSERGRWIDLLPLIDPAKDGVTGHWKRQGSALAILSQTVAGRIMIPVAPEGSYELQAKFVRMSGDDCVAVILPVGSARVMLALSNWHGQDSGLQMINGKTPRDNGTAVRPGTLVNGREYALDITVVAKGDQARIAVRLDGKPYIAWRGPQSALSLSPNWALPKPGCLGLVTYRSVVAFGSVRLKMLSGEARLLRPGGAAAAAAPTTREEAAPELRWADLMPLVDPARDAVKGTWSRQGSALAITGPAGFGRLMFPVAPMGDYEFEVRFVRTAKGPFGGVAFVFPVADGAGTLVLGVAGSKASGLEMIRGQSALSNETTVRGRGIVNGREYAVRVKVLVQETQAQLAAFLDGEPFTSWRGPVAALSVFSGWRLPKPECLGVGCQSGAIEVRSARLKMLSGEARPLRRGRP